MLLSLLLLFFHLVEGQLFSSNTLKKKKIYGITSQTAIEEILDKTDKFSKSIDQVSKFIAESGLVVRASITLEEIKPYENKIEKDDAHLIAGANLTKSRYLVILDKKHLLRKDIQERFVPLLIASPKDLLAEIISGSIEAIIR